MSNSKPPQSARKNSNNIRGSEKYDEDEKNGEFKNIYGDPYNISGKVHPGVSK